MNIKQTLESKLGPAGHLRLNDVDVDPAAIRAVMINEVVPADPTQNIAAMAEIIR